MQPRRDPDTRPDALPVQIVPRPPVNRYGTERAVRYRLRTRAVQTRNGLPAQRAYPYRGAITLEVELPHECDDGCGRRRAKPGQCAVCAGYYDTPGDPE